MLQQIKTKDYWKRVAGYFLWFLLTYTLISYVFREADEPFWSLKEIQSRSIFAFFMAIVFSYRGKLQSASAVSSETESGRHRWTSKEFIGIFGILLLYGVIGMTVLFGIGWMVIQFAYGSVEPFGRTFIRMLMVTAIMTFLATLVLFLCDKYGIRWGRKP